MTYTNDRHLFLRVLLRKRAHKTSLERWTREMGRCGDLDTIWLVRVVSSLAAVWAVLPGVLLGGSGSTCTHIHSKFKQLYICTYGSNFNSFSSYKHAFFTSSIFDLRKILNAEKINSCVWNLDLQIKYFTQRRMKFETELLCCSWKPKSIMFLFKGMSILNVLSQPFTSVHNIKTKLQL